MNQRTEVFNLMGEVSGSIFPLAGEVMPSQFEKYFSEQRFYGPTFLAYQLAPQSLTAELIQRRNPYHNPAALSELLRAAAEEGYLDPARSGDFQISDRGKAAIETVHQVFYEHINEINQFPGSSLGGLAELLEKLVGSISTAEQEGETFCFRCSTGGHPSIGKGTLGEVDQLLDDLNAFRDDAHVTAWKSTGVSGQVWETLTMIWNGTAASAEKLAKNLPYRHYSAEEYQTALDELEGLGWIEKAGQEYRLTGEGKEIREGAEKDTDYHFFGPWDVLSEPELTRLSELLTELRDTNQALL